MGLSRVSSPSARRFAAAAVALGLFSVAARAAGEGGGLTLADALARAEQKGFDALAAGAAVRGAEGDAETARRLRNPAFSGGWLHSTSVPVPGGSASSDGYALAATDQGSSLDVAVGKHGLRFEAAVAAVASARSNREDALRLLRFETTRAYYGVLLAEESEKVGREVAGSYDRTLSLVEERLRFGAASRVDRARVETAKLEADQGVAAAVADVARARAELGVWLGGEDLAGVALSDRLEGALPAWAAAADPAALRAEALASRPDVAAARSDVERTQAALDLARRDRIPDVALSAGYTRQGPEVAPVQPPTFSLGASFELPVLSQRQGEIARAESDREAARVALSRAEARAAADVRSAWAALAAARERIERMEARLYERALEARDLVRYQYREGAITLLDLLDAERTALQVELERAQDRYALRIAVAEVEASVGRRPEP